MRYSIRFYIYLVLLVFAASTAGAQIRIDGGTQLHLFGNGMASGGNMGVAVTPSWFIDREVLDPLYAGILFSGTSGRFDTADGDVDSGRFSTLVYGSYDFALDALGMPLIAAPRLAMGVERRTFSLDEDQEITWGFELRAEAILKYSVIPNLTLSIRPGYRFAAASGAMEYNPLIGVGLTYTIHVTGGENE